MEKKDKKDVDVKVVKVKDIAVDIVNSESFPGISNSTVENILNSFLSNIKKNVLEGNCVSFPGYFKILSKWTKSRPGVDMRTIRDPIKKKVIISSMLVPVFVKSKSFVRDVKDKGISITQNSEK